MSDNLLKRYREWYRNIPGELKNKKGDSPPCVANVSSSIFSIARYYGGCTIGGQYFIYIPSIDTLFREDVWKAMTKEGAIR